MNLTKVKIQHGVNVNNVNLAPYKLGTLILSWLQCFINRLLTYLLIIITMTFTMQF